MSEPLGMGFYDRAGRPIGADEFARLHLDYDYKVIAKDAVGEHEVSTVWLGLDHGFGFLPGSPPLIFETMVFPECEYCERYATEEEARAGHAETVTLVRATEGVRVDDD